MTAVRARARGLSTSGSAKKGVVYGLRFDWRLHHSLALQSNRRSSIDHAFLAELRVTSTEQFSRTQGKEYLSELLGCSACYY